MRKIFYVGQCPICREYGRLEIDKDIMKNECIVICEECLAEWKNPEEALKNLNGKRDGEKGVAIPAPFDDFYNLYYNVILKHISEKLFKCLFNLGGFHGLSMIWEYLQVFGEVWLKNIAFCKWI